MNLIFDVFDLAAFRGNQNDRDEIDYPQPVDEQSYFCDAFIKIIFGKYSNIQCIGLALIKRFIYCFIVFPCKFDRQQS